MALGKKVVRNFQATEEVKRKAERKVMRKAIRKGEAHKYLIGEELASVQGEPDSSGWKDGEEEEGCKEDCDWLLQAKEEMTEDRNEKRESVSAEASRKEEEVKKSARVKPNQQRIY